MRIGNFIIARHHLHNKFPHILWRYLIPKNLMSEKSPYKLYKWLWWYIEPRGQRNETDNNVS